jgi:hypothetical protein
LKYSALAAAIIEKEKTVLEKRMVTKEARSVLLWRMTSCFSAEEWKDDCVGGERCLARVVVVVDVDDEKRRTLSLKALQPQL